MSVADVEARRRARQRPPRRRPRADFRPDIEGLRAVAVLAVIAFHAGAIGGGFIGVDVFFVISGFLITRMLWAERNATGRVRLARFYGARARRLLPAAATVLVATAVAATVLLPPLQARSALDDGLASALYVGNYRLAITGTDYLAHSAPSPFQHYWSLGVEEQFYLLWPVLLLAIGWAWSRRMARPSPTPYLLVLSAIFAASLTLAVLWTHSRPPWAFFSLPTRAWELAAGGLVALSAPLWRRLPPGFAAIAGFGGLAAIGWAATQLDDRIPYPGTAALVPVIGTAAVIVAGCATPTRAAGRLLAIPPLRAVGRLSYSWYLWHWPLLVLAPVAVGHPLGWPGRLAAVAASLALAMLTLRYVERPIRYARPLRRSAGGSLAIGSMVTAAAVSAALLLPLLVPIPPGRGTPAAAAITHSAQRPPSAAPDPLATALTAVRAAVLASSRPGPVPADLTPPLADAAWDKPAGFFDGCVRTWLEVGVPECVSGDPDGPTTVALAGDSHAAMWQPALEPLAARQHWRLVTMAKVTCPLQDLPIISPYLGREYSECRQWRTEAMQRLRDEQPTLIVLSMSRRYGADFGFSAYDPAWMASLTDLVATLRADTGARVLVLGPVPDPHSDAPVCLSAHLDNALACAPERRKALYADGVAGESAATGAGGGQYAELSQLFCTERVCPVIVGTDVVFRDDNHITVSRAQSLAPVLEIITEQAIAPRS